MERSGTEHGCLIFFIGFASKHFFVFVVVVGFSEEEFQHAFINGESSGVSFEEEGKFEPKIVIIVVVAFFAEPAWDLDSVFQV